MESGEQPITDPNTPNLRPPDSAPDTSVDATNNNRWVWVALVIVLILTLLVVFLLPQLVSEHKPNRQQQISAPQNQATPPSVVDDSAASREKAEQALERFLQLRAKLELDRAEVWGEPMWSESSELASSGDRLFGERRFSEAAQTYSKAAQRLEDLSNSRSQVFVNALDAAYRALEMNNSKEAQKLFALALVIEPDHELAQQGLARSLVRNDLLDFMTTGKSAELENELTKARDAYSQAIQLDNAHQPARDSFERINNQIKQINFREAMSSALNALDTGHLSDAGRALEQAARIKPDDRAVHDTRQRLTLTRQQRRLEALRRDALVIVRKEQWQSAVMLYEKAVSVDASAGFAREGLNQARDRVRLHNQIDHYLSDPTRLYSAEPLANAEKLLSMTAAVPSNEPRLAGKMATLQKLVAQARVPVAVQLLSDGQTSVSIYHVGHLGKFQDFQLQLQPGTYTVVGSRPGYRDVRKIIRVQPGISLTPVVIRCEEPV